jgi:2-phosphosulfolactate phosphatase
MTICAREGLTGPDTAVRVRIDCYHDSLEPIASDAWIVAVDVIRSTTTAITCVEQGRRCFIAPTLEAVERKVSELGRPYRVGELGGHMPFGFDATNSPVAVSELDEPDRPVVLLSSSGTRLMTDGAAHATTYVACLRNWRAQAAVLLERVPREVLILGAGTRGEFRDEDQLCAAWIAGALVDGGADAGEATYRLIEAWRDAPVTSIATGKSADYLRASNQVRDLDYVLAHVDDVAAAFVMDGDEVRDEALHFRGRAEP